MSTFKRFVSRDLLRVVNDEKAFMDTVTRFVESGAMKSKIDENGNTYSKEAEKAIVWFYQAHDKLVRKLNEDLNVW